MTFCINLRDLRTCLFVDLIIEMAYKSTNTFRFCDVGREPLRRLPPIRGFENETLVSLEEATKLLIGDVLEIEHMIYTIQSNNIHEKDALTVDESSSIALYLLEWKPREKFFYFILNETSRAPNRPTLLPP